MKIALFLLVCVSSALAASTGPNALRATKHVSGRIVGGQTAPAGEFPYVVGIYRRTAVGTYFCGGALIGTTWIITSASCVVETVQFTLVLGAIHLNTDPNRVQASANDYVSHPGYQLNDFINDIGLITLRFPVVYTDYIKALGLPTTDLVDDMRVTALGWGATDDESTVITDNLNFVELVTIPNTECQRAFRNNITDGMVCVAGNNNEGACRGDQGSPITIHLASHLSWHVGVAIFVSENGCESPDPSGYTRTFDYVDWITERTGITG